MSADYYENLWSKPLLLNLQKKKNHVQINDKSNIIRKSQFVLKNNVETVILIYLKGINFIEKHTFSD